MKVQNKHGADSKGLCAHYDGRKVERKTSWGILKVMSSPELHDHWCHTLDSQTFMMITLWTPWLNFGSEYPDTERGHWKTLRSECSYNTFRLQVSESWSTLCWWYDMNIRSCWIFCKKRSQQVLIRPDPDKGKWAESNLGLQTQSVEKGKWKQEGGAATETWSET